MAKNKKVKVESQKVDGITPFDVEDVSQLVEMMSIDQLNNVIEQASKLAADLSNKKDKIKKSDFKNSDFAKKLPEKFKELKSKFKEAFNTSEVTFNVTLKCDVELEEGQSCVQLLKRLVIDEDSFIDDHFCLETSLKDISGAELDKRQIAVIKSLIQDLCDELSFEDRHKLFLESEKFQELHGQVFDLHKILKKQAEKFDLQPEFMLRNLK